MKSGHLPTLATNRIVTGHSDAVSEITSPANPRVKALVALRKRSVRDDQGVTLVEGSDEIALAVTAGVHVITLYHCASVDPDASHRGLLDLLSQRGVEIVTLSRAAFAKASYRESPDGWLAVVPRPDQSLEAISLRRRPLVLVAEAVEKPGNLGAMLRTAEAAGVDAVVSASPVTDWGNPNVVRASKGTVFAVPVASASALDTIGWLHRKGIHILVATPDGERRVTEIDLTGPLAVVVGAEHAGVSAQWLAEADIVATIPMMGRVNSLNVATSAALVLYEAVRQRGSTGLPG